MIIVTERDKIMGDVFRNNLYSANSIPILAENIGMDISKKFDSSDFLMQSLATQLIIAANIRKNSVCFHDISEQITRATWDIINEVYPDIRFSVSFRGKSFISEIHKRYASICDGNNPIIKDLLAVRIIILNETNLTTLKSVIRFSSK